MLKRRFKLIDIVIFSISITLIIVGLCWHYNHGKWRKKSRSNRVKDTVYRGFEALALNDVHNAEMFFSSFFDETGNPVDYFSKLSSRLQLRTRYVYGDILFCRKNFQKAEMVWRPIFENASSMIEFLSSGSPRKNILISYISALKENENVPEISKVFDICYDKDGSATEILHKFGDNPLLRATAGDFFFEKTKFKRTLNILKPLFENPKFMEKLNAKHQAKSRWHYGYSLIQNNEIDCAKDMLTTFFDENLNPTESFKFLDRNDQIICRLQYSLLLLKENHSEKILKLMAEFFDKNGELVPQIESLPFQDMIRYVHGYILCRQGKHSEAAKAWSWLLKTENKNLVKNLTADEINLIASLCTNIKHMHVKQW